jgi:hypothetical protein
MTMMILLLTCTTALAGGSPAQPHAAAPPDASQVVPCARILAITTSKPARQRLNSPRRAADFKQHLVFVEAENMTTTGGWRALDWAYSDNYYAATIADTFLSRRSQPWQGRTAVESSSGAVCCIPVVILHTTYTNRRLKL